MEAVDPLHLACVLTRSAGMDGPRTDPLMESRDLTRDLRMLRSLPLEQHGFDEPELTRWRLRLVGYAQLVEMDGPLFVMANLLRLKCGLSYSLSPFVDLRKRMEKAEREGRQLPFGIPSVPLSSKLQKMDSLAAKAGVTPASEIFGRFYFRELRNAIQHADYALDGKRFCMRSGCIPEKAGGNVMVPYVPLERIDEILTEAETFYDRFFSVEEHIRGSLAQSRGQVLPYDPGLKGLLEFLVDDAGLLCGWKVHWPNGSDSYFRRDESGCKAVNWHFSDSGPSLMVGLIHEEHERSRFSPLVHKDAEPKYTPCEGSDEPIHWPKSASDGDLPVS
ncbi:MAG: hypothetical protein AAF550_04895 [Myxococcota bacterium]